MKLKRNDPRNIQKGDQIRILVPKVITYVGYENNKNNVYKDVMKVLSLKSGEVNPVDKCMVNMFDLDEKVLPCAIIFKEIEEKIQKELGITVRTYRKNVLSKIASAIAYEIVGQKMATANQERKKFEETEQILLGRTCEVIRTKYQKIGTRVPSYSCGDSNYGDDYEPGYLEDERTLKTVFISKYLKHGQSPWWSKKEVKRYECQIDTVHVEKVIPFDKMTYVLKWLKQYWEVMSLDQKSEAFSFFVTKDNGSKDVKDFIDDEVY